MIAAVVITARVAIAHDAHVRCPAMVRLALILAAIVACSHSKAVTTSPSAGTTFELGEITVFEGQQATLKLHANGMTEIAVRSGEIKLEPGKVASSDSLPVVWKPGLNAHTDGTIEKDGKSIRVNSDGTVTAPDANGKIPPITITADQATLTEHGKPLAIALGADGTVRFPGHDQDAPADKRVHVEGADTPGKRRLVLTLLMLMYSVDDADQAPPPAASP
jgi:hypothetical protein